MLTTILLSAILAIVLGAYAFLISPQEKKERLKRQKKTICVLTQFSVDRFGRVNPLISEHADNKKALAVALKSDMAYTLEEYEVFDSSKCV